MIVLSLSLEIYQMKVINQAKQIFSEYLIVKVERDGKQVRLSFICEHDDKSFIIKSFLNYCLDASAAIFVEA